MFDGSIESSTDLIKFLRNRSVCPDGVTKGFSVLLFTAFICTAAIVCWFASEDFSSELEL